MLLMFERGIRGGITQSIHRYAEANNKCMDKFNPEKPSSYIQYLDTNNLYRWAMSHLYPLEGLNGLISEALWARYAQLVKSKTRMR